MIEGKHKYDARVTIEWKYNREALYKEDSIVKIDFKSKSAQAYLNLSLCILLWASIPVATKKMLVELDNLQILLYSTILSTLVLGVLLIAQGKVKELRKYGKMEYGVMHALGFLGNYLYYVLLYGALSMTTASEGFILAYTWPILVLVLAFVILKEQVTLRKIIGVCISFIGIIVITTKGNLIQLNLTSAVGDAMALSAAFVFALFSIMGKKYNFDKTISVFIYFFAALVFIVPTVLIFSDFVVPSSNIMPWILYNGIFVNGISYIFWFKALENGKTHIISNMLYLTPFVSLIYIFLFLKEEILMSSIVGLMFIVLGILSQNLGFMGGGKRR